MSRMPRQLIPTVALAAYLLFPATRLLAQHEPQTGTSDRAAHDTAAARESAVARDSAAVGHSTPVEHEGATGHGEHAKPPLLPNLEDKQTWFSALWTIIIFIVLLVVLYPTAWKNVLAGLKAREERIRKDIADAEAARARAESTLREYNQQLANAEQRVRDMIAKAQTDAEKVATGIRMQAQQDAEEAKERATREIESARDQALADIYRQAADLSTAIAEKILRRNLNPDDQRDLVNQSLEQLQTVSR